MKKIAVLTVFLMAAVGAQAQQPQGWYGGVDVGSTKVDGVPSLTGLGVTLGYQIQSQVAVEGALRRLGSRDGADLSAFQVSAVGSVPVSGAWSAYGRLGWGHNTASTSSGRYTISSDDNSLLFGLGLRYAVDKKLALRTEIDRVSTDITQINLGLTYAF